MDESTVTLICENEHQGVAEVHLLDERGGTTGVKESLLNAVAPIPYSRSAVQSARDVLLRIGHWCTIRISINSKMVLSVVLTSEVLCSTRQCARGFELRSNSDKV